MDPLVYGFIDKLKLTHDAPHDGVAPPIPNFSDLASEIDNLHFLTYDHLESHLVTSSDPTNMTTNLSIKSLIGESYSSANMAGITDRPDSFFDEFEQRDTSKTPKQPPFDLSIPTGDKTPQNMSRLTRRSFAIACHPLTTKENLLKYIQHEFNNIVQYVCIFSPNELPRMDRLSSPMYIQIILERSVSKRAHFLKAVAGMQCNYRVTNDDRAWNTFLKEGGDYIEIGQFRSVRTRAGIKWSKTLHRMYKEESEISLIEGDQLPTVKRQRVEKQIQNNVIVQLSVSLEKTTDLAHTNLPADCSQISDTLLLRLKILPPVEDHIIIL